MPTYDYRCDHCQHAFSAMHKIADPAPQCPNCGGAVSKQLSAPAVHGGGGARQRPVPRRLRHFKAAVPVPAVIDTDPTSTFQ